MKVIFLDIDGVLNSSRSCQTKLGPRPGDVAGIDMICDELEERMEGDLGYGPRHSIKTVDIQCVALLNDLVEKTGAEIVLSSSHRTYFIPREGFGSPRHIELLNMYLWTLGVRKPIIDVTPQFEGLRGDQIDYWIGMSDEPIEQVILDDSTDFHPSQVWNDLVLTDSKNGFAFEDYVRSLNMLGVKNSGIIV